MTRDPDDKIINGAREDDKWAPGEMDDGSINTFDESQLAERTAERDAYEQAFDGIFEPESADEPDDSLDDADVDYAAEIME